MLVVARWRSQKLPATQRLMQVAPEWASPAHRRADMARRPSQVVVACRVRLPLQLMAAKHQVRAPQQVAVKPSQASSEPLIKTLLQHVLRAAGVVLAQSENLSSV